MNPLVKVAQKFMIRLGQQQDPFIELNPGQKTAYKNHVIRINQQAHILSDEIKAGIAAGNTKPEAQSQIDSFKNIAVRYTGLAQQDSKDTQQLINLFRDLTRIYDIIARNYVDQTYQPMKLIRESLHYIGSFGPVRMWRANVLMPGALG